MFMFVLKDILGGSFENNLGTYHSDQKFTPFQPKCLPDKFARIWSR